MLLSILVPALEGRPWEGLVGNLLAQASPYGDRVEVLVEVDGGRMTSGQKRQLLAESSTGDYRAFVDDDDLVAADYVDELVRGCASGADVVTFDMLFRVRGGVSERWRLVLGEGDRKAGYMSANHLCAWRSDLADRVAWCPDLGYADDQLWYKPMVASGIARTEWRVNKTLYTYKFDPNNTANQTPARSEDSLRYFNMGLDCFFHHGEIVVEAGGGPKTPDEVMVRDRYNRIAWLSRSSMRKFLTVRAD